MDPESKLLLTVDVGERTLAMAQWVVHHVAQMLAPGCMPLFLTDGFKEYLTALLTHFGHWVAPVHRQTKPRWMPLPQLLYAQVVKTVHRRRLVRVYHRVVFGTLERVQQVLTAHGWQINTAFVERVKPHDPPACGRRRASSHHAVQTGGQPAAAVRIIPDVSQLLSAPCLLTPTVATARAHQREWLAQTVASLYAGHGCWPDRSCLAPERGTPVPRATVAPATRAVSSE